MSAHLADRHRIVLKALGGALTLGGDLDAWSRVARILYEGLSPSERAWLLHAVLNVTEPDDAFEIAEACLSTFVEGPPLPVLDEIEDSARWWADTASLPELRAWLAACFVRLPARDRAEFVAHAAGRVAA